MNHRHDPLLTYGCIVIHAYRPTYQVDTIKLTLHTVAQSGADLWCGSGVVSTRSNGYWVSSTFRHALLCSQGEGGSYIDIGMGRFVNERFKATFLPIWHLADINSHFVSDCSREVRTGGSRGKCTCFTPNPFSITGTVLMWHVSECVPGVLSIYISLRRWSGTPAQRLIYLKLVYSFMM